MIKRTLILILILFITSASSVIAATITKSIGSDGRDYSTITLWQAALSGAAGGAGNDAVGEAYADSDFGESVIFNDETPDSIRLTAASGQRHDGTSTGGGVVIDIGDAAASILTWDADSPTGIIEWLRLTGWLASGANKYAINSFISTNGRLIVRNNIVHDGGNYGIRLYDVANHAGYNNIVYDVTKSGNFTQYGIYLDGNKAITIANNTVYNTEEYGIRTDEIAHVVKNNISVVNGTLDYRDIASSADSDYNVDSDGTAPDAGGNSITSTAGNLFVSTVGDSEDLRLKAGADAIDEGVDLGTTGGVNIDIVGRDRDAQGDTWDIGANEFVAAAVDSYLRIKGAMRIKGGIGIMGPGPSIHVWACGETLVYGGDNYDTVLIGSQCWMAENLNVTDGNEDQTCTFTRYCYDDNASNCDTYGGLYLWADMMCGESSSNSEPSGVQGICPNGWHIPSHYEWVTLERQVCDDIGNNPGCDAAFPKDLTTGYFGQDTTTAEGEGSAMAANEPLWTNGDLDNSGDGDNDFATSGLNLLPASYRLTDGSYSSLGYYSFIRSSLGSGGSAWRRRLSHDRTDVHRSTSNELFGFSVRCLKD